MIAVTCTYTQADGIVFPEADELLADTSLQQSYFHPKK